MCKAKINKEIDIDWSEIVDILEIDVHYDHLRKIAYGLIEYDNYIKSYDGVATRILSISDLHVPFHKPIKTFCDYVGIVDILQINGDVTDCQAISKFLKIYRNSPMEELILARQYLIDLIEYIRPKKVVITKGNHDSRFQKYFAKNIDTDLLELLPETALDLIFKDGFNHYNKKTKSKTFYDPIEHLFDGIEVDYTGDWKCKIGKTWFCHPNNASGQTLKTCEKAVEFFHKTDREDFSCVVLAHTHRVSYAKQGYIHLYEQGTCADTTKLEYMDGDLSNPQKEGFLYLCQDVNGDIIENKTKQIKLN